MTTWRSLRCKLLNLHGPVSPLPGWTRLGSCDWCGETRGMRVRMPSGQILTVTAISEPDENRVVRVTCDVEEPI